MLYSAIRDQKPKILFNFLKYLYCIFGKIMILAYLKDIFKPGLKLKFKKIENCRFFYFNFSCEKWLWFLLKVKKSVIFLFKYIVWIFTLNYYLTFIFVKITTATLTWKQILKMFIKVFLTRLSKIFFKVFSCLLHSRQHKF